jgi:hypothetical protein
MNPVKIVLSNDEHDEYELGMYSQGVNFNICMVGKVDVVDVASGEIVCIQTEKGWQWGEHGPYEDIFVHGVSDQLVEDGEAPEINLRSLQHLLAETDGHSIRDDPTLSVRARNALLRGGLKTLEDVSKRTKREYIMFWPNFGQSCADEVELALHSVGLDYREET